MICSGIDEAGLGPLLGPYCAGIVSFSYEDGYSDPRISCGSLLSAEPGAGFLAVGDSKKIYSPGKMRELEQTVLTFYESFTGKQISTAKSFFEGLSANGPGESAPWFKRLESLSLPLSAGLKKEEISALSRQLKEALASENMKIHSLALSVVPAREFNRLLDRNKNKAAACQKIISPLLRYAVNHSDSVVVDRQGGRRYYGDWLVELFPGRLLTALRELKDLSRYRLENCQIDFQVGADAISFETSLASMFAKYSRELCMRAFNDYWFEKSPDLKPTAGYYSDGQRFLKDLQDRDLLPEDKEILIRRK